MQQSLLRAIFSLAIGLLTAFSPATFEDKPRQITAGRDPMIAVRASGAVSLMKFDKGDLWLHTSFNAGDSFEPPVRINDIAGEVSSHGESSPQMIVRSRSEFYCLWQARRPEGADGSALRFSRSTDWGESFSKARDVESSPESVSQSFFSMNVSPKGVIFVAWLDSRDRGRGHMGTSAVYISRSQDRGISFSPGIRVSLDACPCCRPVIGFTGDKAIHVAWRKVLDDNIRDIFLSTSRDGGESWSPGVLVSKDNWSLNGCPHSGATLAALGSRLFASWYSVREKQPGISFAYSDDLGETFSPPVNLSGEVVDPNHPYMLSTGETISVVFQGREPLRNKGWAPQLIYYRELDAHARLSTLMRVGNSGSSATYPTIAFEEPGRLYLVWSEPSGDAQGIVLARGRRVSNSLVDSMQPVKTEDDHVR